MPNTPQPTPCVNMVCHDVKGNPFIGRVDTLRGILNNDSMSWIFPAENGEKTGLDSLRWFKLVGRNWVAEPQPASWAYFSHSEAKEQAGV